MPSDGIGQEAAGEWPDHGAETEHGPEQALVLAAFSGCEQVADHRERDRKERPRPEALDAAEQDQHRHVLRQPGQGRADQEDDHADHQQRLAAVEVGQLAVERDGDGRGQQVDREDPVVVLVATEVGHDPRQRGPHDCLVECPEEQGEHDRTENLELGALTQAEGRVILDRRRACAGPSRE